MNGVELIRSLTRTTRYPEEVVRDVLDAFFEEVACEVEKGSRVSLRNFGTFERHVRKAKIAQDFGRKLSIEVPEKHVPRFRPSETFINRVRDYGNDKK